MERSAAHVPVMLDEVLEHLRPRPGQVVVDGTAGTGGHAAAVWERIRPGGRLLLVDRDPEALQRLQARFGRQGDIRYFHANFADFDLVLAECGLDRADAVLLDLGVSSEQLSSAPRGFTFSQPGALDMRMDPGATMTAADLVNRWTAERLAALFRDYGDQPMAGRIARAIVEARRRGPIRRTDELADLVAAALPAAWRRTARTHPATRVFQALRIAVNDELGSLERFFEKVWTHLAPGGRVAVIAFHSGEDRIVKERLRQAARDGLIEKPLAKPLTPTPAEVAANPRSRSARLRVGVRL